MQRVNIKVAGHCGTWYIIAYTYFMGERAYLLEHEKYGDEVASVLINEKGELLLEDIWNGETDIMQAEANKGWR